jgi:hypothetical protein
LLDLLLIKRRGEQICTQCTNTRALHKLRRARDRPLPPPPPHAALPPPAAHAAKNARTLSRANWAHCVPYSPWPSKTPKRHMSLSPLKAVCTQKASWLALSGESG